MSTQLTEREVLNKLDIPDFRHMSKDKVMTFVSMLNSMEPEVAKKAIEQFPEFSRMTLEALQDYKGVMEKSIDANSVSSKQCFDIYNEIVSALKKCLECPDLSFEEKKYYIEQMKEIAQMSGAKDSENKSFLWKALGIGALAVIVTVGAGITALGGNVDLNLPKINSKSDL